MILRFFNIALAAAALLLATPGMAKAEAVTIHGSTTVNANLFEPHKAALEAKTGLEFTIVANGSSRGLKGLRDGAANIGMISSDFDGVAKKIGLTDADKADYHPEQVGEERIVYAVHASNPVTSLTKDQIVGILNGSITNWSAIGGNAAPILVVSEYAGGGFRTTVEKKLLSKAPISAPSLKAMPNGPQVVKVGEQVPTAFAAIPSTMLKGSTMKVLETDADIVQPLVLVAKGTPSAAFTKLVETARELLQ